METENVKHLSDVRITGNTNNEYQVILTARSVNHAEAMKYDLGKELALSYDYDDDMNSFYLIFDNATTEENILTISIDVSEKTLEWMDWINEKIVTSVCVLHPDGKGGLAVYGSLIPVRV